MPTILGIDLAKASFQVTLLHGPRPQHHRFANTPEGFATLHAWLTEQGVTALHAGLEATGRYGEPLAEWLHAQGYTVSVVNPAQIKHYAQSQLRRNKTDKVDANVIAHYTQTQVPPAWQPTAPALRELTELLHQYDTLQEARQQVVNRLHAGVQSEVVRQQLTQHQLFLEAQLADLRRLIHEHIAREPELKKDQALLTSIPGLGDLTAARMQTLQLHRFKNARAASAFVGLNPQQHTSGTSVHRRTRLSKMGRADVRRALYMPAVVAKQHNPLVRDLCRRLEQKAKPPLAILGAAMHKLVCLAYGVVKSNQPFDPHFAQIQRTTA